MKSGMIILPALLLMLLGSVLTGHSKPRDRGEITLHGSLNTSCISSRGGHVYLHMVINTPATANPERRPMNISVVLDRSGSMGDARKMEYAKEAVLRLIDGLTSDDFLSIVVYDDVIETLLPVQRVRDRERIRRLVQEVYPRGSTNLGGGMIEGFASLVDGPETPGCEPSKSSGKIPPRSRCSTRFNLALRRNR